MNDPERSNTSPEALTTKQLDTILALLSSPTIEAAAKRAKVSKVSIYQWLKEKPFREELGRQRRYLMSQSLNCLVGTMGKALETLISLLEKGTPAVRRLAAKDLIDFTLKVSEVEEIKKRLSLVETSLARR